MSWASVRLEFLRGFMSRAEILAETGLTNELQNEILNEVYNPTGDTRRWLRNVYERQSYSYLRDTGFSSTQAARFNTYTPDSVINRANIVGDLIDRLTDGAWDLSLAKKGLDADSFEGESLYNEIQGSIIEGFQNSNLMYEQWIEEYGKAAEEFR